MGYGFLIQKRFRLVTNGVEGATVGPSGRRRSGMGMILGNSIEGRGAAIAGAVIPTYQTGGENGVAGRFETFPGISASGTTAVFRMPRQTPRRNLPGPQKRKPPTGLLLGVRG